jgi:hypothetical protein
MRIKSGFIGKSVWLVIVVFAVFLAACPEDPDNNNNNNNGNGTGTHDIDSSLYGTWRDDNGYWIITFSSDGITWGGLGGNAFNSLPSSIKWTAKNGAISHIHSGTTTKLFDYNIDSFGKLILTDPATNFKYTLTKDGSNGGNPGTGNHDIDSSLYGTWRNNNNTLVITFSSDGITWGGTVGNAFSNLPSDTKWTAKNGTISHTYSGTTTKAYDYTINSSNLILTSISGANYTLTKDGGSSTDPTVNVPGSTLAQKLAWVRNADNVQNGGIYTIEVSADEAIAPQALDYSYNKSDITIILKGIERERIVSLSDNGSLFTVGYGVTLILDINITLQGKSDNDSPLVVASGALEMKVGAKISGNTNTSSYYGCGGVEVGGTFTMNGGEISGNTSSTGGGVGVGGTFTMNGGEISGNTSSSSSSYDKEGSGGGVYVGGTFTMNGGEISGNTSSGSSSWSGGGGVYVNERGTLTMTGGKISGNTSSYASGGGVYVGGTFTMNGGEISGNTSSGSSSWGGGGGVYVYSNGTFTMTGGKISGNTSTNTSYYGGGGGVFVGGTFTMNDGEISGNTAFNPSSTQNLYFYGGGGVYVGVSIDSPAIFSMRGGKISGNTSSHDGGGVYVSYSIYSHRQTNFTMLGGEISGNTANTGGGVFLSKKGIENNTLGFFRIVNGTVYGSNAGTGLRNTDTQGGAALYNNGIAQSGTFNGETWNYAGNLTTTNNTIRVVNGVLQN